MQNFIATCVSEIINSDTVISKAIFILPSKRAGVFLKKELAQQLKKTIFLPKIISIEEFIEEVSELKTINNLETLFAFYNVYETIIPKKLKEPFESFSKWAQVLLHDFNEIDRYKIDAKTFFENLSNIKQLEKWELNEEPTELIKNYLDFWKNCYRYYEDLKVKLLNNTIGYQGLIYREASNNIEYYIENHKKIKHYFLGFNALNASEEDIFQELQQQGLAKIYWDTDAVFFKDKTHSASHFLRKYKNNWKYYEKYPFKFISKSFQEDKQIHFFALPKNISQAKKVGQLLQNLSTEELKETAVVLGDENLLLPVLNALPSNVTGVNITMGLSLKNVPLTSFFERIFMLYIQQKGNRFYYKRILQLITDNYAKLTFGADDFRALSTYIYKNNTISLSAAEILKIIPNNQLLQKLMSLKTASVSECLSVFSDIILKLKEKFSNDKNENSLNLEYLYRFYEVFNKLEVLQKKHQVLNDVSGLYQIYKEIIGSETLDFKGDPAKGLQIMGMLESRALDFKRIILTSVNEGVLPAGKSYNSFIPFDLKIAFKLPTYFDKDAVYAYHFFRLIQRAQNVNLLYNTEPDVLNAGEKSRFLLQLETALQPNHNIEYHTNSPSISTALSEIRIIKKDDVVIARLQEIASIHNYKDKEGNNKIKGGFSPSALTQYVRNPIDFYTQKILQIYKEDEVEEIVASNTLGTIVHNTLESFYKPFEKTSALSEKNVREMQKKIDKEIRNQFNKEFKKGDISKGKNLIIFSVAKQYIYNFLKEEIKQIQSGKTIKIHKIEADLRMKLSIKNIPFPVYIAGKVDRIDEIDGVIRIIDYKTGKVDASQIQIHDWDILTKNYDKGSKPLQVLTYACMVKQSNLFPNKPIEAGVISFKNLKSGFIKFGKKEKQGKVSKNNVMQTKINENVFESYLEQLKKLITEICDINTPFTEKEV